MTVNSFQPERPLLGMIGNSTIDYYCPQAEVETRKKHMIMRFAEEEYRIPSDAYVTPGAKIPGDVPPAARAQALWEEVGGGLINSMRGMAMIAPDLPLHVLDLCRSHPKVQAELGGLKNLTISNGNLRPVPKHGIFGKKADKVIVASVFIPAQTLTKSQINLLHRFASCETVLLNSVKDPSVLDAFFTSCPPLQPMIYIVLHPSTPEEVLRRVVFPRADVIFTSWDEIGGLLGERVAPSISNTLAALRRLRVQSPRTEFVVTLGSQGALVSAPCENGARHVRLTSRRISQIRPIVLRKPVATVGCGDVFAAGYTACRSFGRTLLYGGSNTSSPQVAAAMAANIAAVRNLGFDDHLTADDFEVLQTSFPIEM